MTREEVRAEMSRLGRLERELEEKEREEHRQTARKFVGRCYKSDSGKIMKIIDIPRTFLAKAGARYDPNKFPVVLLYYPEAIPRNQYIDDDSEEFAPVYYDYVYLDIKKGVPEMGYGHFIREHCEEITQEEFNAEFAKCIAHFKELIK